MKRVYLVSTGTHHSTVISRGRKEGYERAGALVSYYALRTRRNISDLVRPDVPTMLDSGAFSARSKGTPIDVTKYADFLTAHSGLFEATVSLDVIGDWKGSRANYLYLRSRGLRAIPVYHGGEPLDALYTMLDEDDYIGLGGMVQRGGPRLAETMRWLERTFTEIEKRRPGCRVHGFGVTAQYAMFTFPWHTVDSSSWMSWSRYGAGTQHFGGLRTLSIRAVRGQKDYDQYFRSVGIPPKRSLKMKEVNACDLAGLKHMMRFVDQHDPRPA